MPKAKVYNTLWDLDNSLDHTQAEKFDLLFIQNNLYFKTYLLRLMLSSRLH